MRPTRDRRTAERPGWRAAHGAGRARVSHAACVLAWALATMGCAASDDCDGSRVARELIACLGDSNTHQPDETSWCDLLAEESKETSPRFLNYGFPGARAAAVPKFRVIGGDYWLERALALAPPRVVILAYGTNDLQAATPPAQIVDQYRALKQQAEQAGARVLIALTPPLRLKHRDYSAEVTALNDLLRSAFPPESLLDFHTGFAENLAPDGVHLTPEGHAKRARIVRKALGLADSGAD